jgi:hypothetical protein
MSDQDQATRKYQQAKKLSKYFPIIELNEGNKNPVKTGWQEVYDEKITRKNTKDTLKALKDGERINYGLVMNKHDYIALDLDHIYDEETYPKYCEFYDKYNLDTMMTRTLSLGYHFIFKVSEYAIERWNELGKNSLEARNIEGWVDTRHGGQVVGPGCTVENNEKYRKGGEKHEYADNEYELLVNKKPIEISDELVDYIVEGMLNKKTLKNTKTKKSTKTTTKKDGK